MQPREKARRLRLQVEQLEQRDLLTTLALTDNGWSASSSPLPDQFVAAQAAPLVHMRAEVTDLEGRRLTSLQVGQEFRLSLYIDDLRSDLPHPGGAFAGYVTVGYQAGLVTVEPGSLALDRFWSMMTIRDLSKPGLITAGGATTSLLPPGSDEQLLWTATFKATAAGTITFDTAFTSRNEFLLYGLDGLIGPKSIRFESLEIAIHGAPQPPALVVGPGFALEGRTGTTELQFQITLNAPTDHPVTVAWTTQDATAEAGSDYQATSGTLTFLPGGPQTQWVTVLVDGDQTREPDVMFRLVLHDPSGATILGPDFGLGVIQDDDQRFYGDPAQSPVSEPPVMEPPVIAPPVIEPPVTQSPVIQPISPTPIRSLPLDAVASPVYELHDSGNFWLVGWEIPVPRPRPVRERYFWDLPKSAEGANEASNPLVSTGIALSLEAAPADASAGVSETGGRAMPLAFALTVASNRTVEEPSLTVLLPASIAGDELPADRLASSFDAYLSTLEVDKRTSPAASNSQAHEHDGDWLDELLAGMDLL